MYIKFSRYKNKDEEEFIIGKFSSLKSALNLIAKWNESYVTCETGYWYYLYGVVNFEDVDEFLDFTEME